MTATVPSGHVHVSEDEPGTDEDCLWCSFIEFYRQAYDPSIPATKAEALAVRAASGEPESGGSNIGNLRTGVKVRYGRSLPASITGFADFWAAFQPGTAAIVSGKMTLWRPHLRRWYPGFTGGHSVAMFRPDASDTAWLCDPGGDVGIGYVGEVITKAEVKQFISTYGFSQIVHAMLPDAPAIIGDTMPDLSAYLPGYLATVKKDASIRDAPKLTATKLRGTSAPEAWVVTGWAKGEAFNGNDQWLTRWNAGRWEYTVAANVTAGPEKPPVGGFTQADLDAAVAKQKTADDIVCSAKVSTAVATSTQAEKDRIAAVLGI